MLREKVGLSWLVLAMIIALPFPVPVPGAAVEPQGPETAMARVEAGPARVEWLPQVDYERLVLTVSGPGDRFIRREFETGKPVSLSLFDSAGNRLPDGNYVWELRVVVPKTGQTGGQPQRPTVLSGYFSVHDGSFVTKTRNTPRQAPKSPPGGITPKDLVESGNLIVKSRACIGSSCGNSDATIDALRLKVTHPNILFDETGAGPGGATFDWALEGNPSNVDQFSIASNDGTSTLTPFTLTGGAPDNSLFVAANGNLGLGTATPAAKLHLFDNTDVFTMLTMENSSTGGSAVASLHAVSNSASAFLQAQGSGRTISHFGQAVASWAELLQVAGNGLIIGTIPNTPLILGTNNVNRLQIDGSTGAVTVAGNLTVNGTFSNPSSRELKESFTPLDPSTVLQKFAQLRISEWSYKSDEQKLRHVGPTVEDFRNTFGLGTEGQYIFPMDVQGVTMVAVQGLNQVVQDKALEIATLRRENAELAKRVEALEAMLSKMLAQAPK